MSRRRISAATAAVFAIVSMATAVTAATAASPASPSGVKLGPSSINWGQCASATLRFFGSKCAMVDVPLDYAHPNGPTIKLAVSMHRHTSPASLYQGVMLVNPGGPGGSGLIFSVFGDPRVLGNRPVAAQYDWIGFDPRGVGSSVPSVSCDTHYFDFNRPNYIPVNVADLAAWNARSAGYAADCAAKNGPILQHLTTIDSAKDMDRIRRALGAPQINYYGFSYGTYLGQVYGTLFPSHVRRMVLDSNVDPRNIWYQANLNQDLAFNRNIEIWFGWLARYDSVYHLGATQSEVEATFYRTQARLTFHPADGKIGGDEWTDTFLYAGYFQSTWLELADVLSGYINHGDVAALEQEYANNVGMGQDNGYAVYLGVSCTDIQWPQNESTWLADNWRVYSEAPYATWLNNWFNAPCLFWPAPAHATKPFQVDMHGVSSALLIDETLDPATPYEGSLYLRSIFPNARLLALPGGTTHAGSLDGNACENRVDFTYLETGALPADHGGNGPDATCAPNPQPNPTAAAATTTASTLRQQLQVARGVRP